VQNEDLITWGIAGGLAGWLISWVQSVGRRIAKGPGGHPYPLPKSHGVPFATGPKRPVWPIHPDSRNPRMYEVAYRDVHGKAHGNFGGRGFSAKRGSGARKHAGIDIYANGGDVVRAPESGVIIADQKFLGSIPGEDAMLIQGDSGTVILLGEIIPESMTTRFGLKEGSRVQAGDPVALVGTTQNGSHMLHFETYVQGTKRNRQWRANKSPPTELRDPTAYLLRARAGTGQPAMA